MAAVAPVITIDGPSGSGKGTLGQLLAQALGWHFLDSGALYRVLALAAMQEHIDLSDELGLARLAERLDIKFKITDAQQPPHVFLAGIDVTSAIRQESCGSAASKVAMLPAVRQALLERQRAFRQWPGLVTDGRDMGSVVFPDAPLKFFLAASCEERARRRYYQLKQKGINVSLDALYAELSARDKRDRERQIAPLKPTADAVVIDTTTLTIEQVLEQLKAQAHQVLAEAIRAIS